MEALDFSISYIKEEPTYIDQVKNLGDKNSKTIGFFPGGAFDRAADDNLIILAIKDGVLLGYLMYREVKRDNTVSITHLCIDDRYRKKGVAKQLFNSLKNKMSLMNGIFLKCRKDYKLDSFWQGLGFIPRDELPGRSQAGSILVKWWYNNPEVSIQQSLFSPSSLFKVVLDANILFDLTSSDVINESHAILADWLEDIDLCVTSEIFNEINRNEDSVIREKSIKSAEAFSLLSCNIELLDDILLKLKKIIDKDSVSSDSDRKQLAHSIGCSVDYFLTRDIKILNKSKEVYEAYGIEILRPSDLIIQFDRIINESSYKPEKLLNILVEKKKIAESDIPTLYECFAYRELEKKSLFETQIRDLIVNTKAVDAFVISVADVPEIFVIVSYDMHVQRVHYLRAKSGTNSFTLLHKVIFDLIKKSITKKATKTEIIDSNLDNLIVATAVLENYGFHLNNTIWEKSHVIGVYESKENLLELRGELFSLEEKNTLEPAEIEKRFWPCKILGHNNSFVISIEPHWARELFDEELASQDIFGAQSTQLIFNNKNVYYRSSSNYGMCAGDRIFWYVKNDKNLPQSRAIRGLSIIESVKVGPAKTIFKEYKNFGIFRWEDILKLCDNNPDKDVMAIVFKNTEVFEHGLAYSEAVDLINSNGISFNNFQAPLKINDELFTKFHEKIN